MVSSVVLPGPIHLPLLPQQYSRFYCRKAVNYDVTHSNYATFKTTLAILNLSKPLYFEAQTCNVAVLSTWDFSECIDVHCSPVILWTASLNRSAPNLQSTNTNTGGLKSFLSCKIKQFIEEGTATVCRSSSETWILSLLIIANSNNTFRWINILTF